MENKNKEIEFKKAKTEAEKITEAVNESLKTILSTEYLVVEERIQAITAWQLKRIADALEKIADCEYKGGLVTWDAGKI
ncbi:MAG: hypothetical protein ACTSQ8_23545 [Candidatus Helarchaeota archaeon]